MSPSSLQWSFVLDPSAPPALGAFLRRAVTDWLPAASARRELALPTVVVVRMIGGRHARVLPCAPAEAAALAPGAALGDAPPEGAVWCVAMLPRARGRWWVQHVLAPPRGMLLALVRGDDGDVPGGVSTEPSNTKGASRRRATLREHRARLR